MSPEEECTWCGVRVAPDDGFRGYEPSGERRAVFCRLEHVVPWALNGPYWEAGPLTEPPGTDELADHCAFCEAPIGEVHVLLVRHRGEFRVPDAFCSVEHLRQWSQGGGRWR
jgi:hypothetical protein